MAFSKVCHQLSDPKDGHHYAIPLLLLGKAFEILITSTQIGYLITSFLDIDIPQLFLELPGL